MLVLHIKQIIIIKGISLNKEIGYSKFYLFKIEIGERKLSFEIALLIANALKIDVSKLGEII